MVFLEITNIRQKSRNFWFADFFLKIFKIHRLVWIFSFEFLVVLLCFINVLLKVINNLKFYKHSFIKDTFRSIFVS